MTRSSLLVALLLAACSSDPDPAASTTGPSGSGGSSSGSGGAGASGAEGTGATGAGASSTGGTGGDGANGGTGGSVPVDPTFSFVIIPDTQNEVLSDNNTAKHFIHRAQWILDNKDDLDIRFALQTGDLCNWDTPTHDQYERASGGLQLFDDANFLYALTIGNHDSAATCTGGSACPGDVNANLRNTSTFNSYFPTSRFPWLTDTFEPNKVDNATFEIEAGGLHWLIIAMELWPRTEAYQWVGDVLASHPNHNAIVFTHDHLTGTGNINQSNGGYGNNSPQTVFDEVLSQHPNVRFVFSGHEGKVAFRQDSGVSGNGIYQFMFNQDDATNPTRIIQIDTEAKTIDATVYGPATDKTYDDPGATVNLTNVDFVQ